MAEGLLNQYSDTLPVARIFGHRRGNAVSFNLKPHVSIGAAVDAINQVQRQLHMPRSVPDQLRRQRRAIRPRGRGSDDRRRCRRHLLPGAGATGRRVRHPGGTGRRRADAGGYARQAPGGRRHGAGGGSARGDRGNPEAPDPTPGRTADACSGRPGDPHRPIAASHQDPGRIFVEPDRAQSRHGPSVGPFAAPTRRAGGRTATCGGQRRHHRGPGAIPAAVQPCRPGRSGSHGAHVRDHRSTSPLQSGA